LETLAELRAEMAHMRLLAKLTKMPGPWLPSKRWWTICSGASNVLNEEPDGQTVNNGSLLCRTTTAGSRLDVNDDVAQKPHCCLSVQAHGNTPRPR
jgi:hypothetical protein